MHRIHLSLVVASCCLTATLSVANAADPLPLEAFTSLEQMSRPNMSPDGHHVVFIDRSVDDPVIMIMDVDTGHTSKLLSGTAENYQVTQCEFKNDTRVICHFSAWLKTHDAVGRASRMVAINVDRSELKVLSQYGNGSVFQDEIIDMLRDDPRNILIELYEEDAWSPSVFSMDVYTAKLERIVKGAAPVRFWSTDRTGQVRFGWGFDKGAYFYKARDSQSAPWRILHPKSSFDSHDFRVYGFGVEPNKLVVSALRNGRVAVWDMDIGDNNDSGLLFSLPQYDVAGPMIWPSDGRLVGFAYAAEKPQLELFDEQARTIQATIEKLLPGTTARVVGGSRDGQRLLVASASDRQPAQFFMLDLRAKSMRPLRRNAPLLTTDKLVDMKPVVIPGADGVQIPGYLLLPAGGAANKLPAVVLPHGERFSRDGWGFEPIAQMLANRGYAVLRINYRGTGGYGRDWLQAGYRDAGTTMLSDVNAGTRWLVAQGIADPKRICLMGSNTGGYIALLGGIRTPELYRCIVSIGAITDLKEQMWGKGFFYFGERLQIPLKDEQTGEEASPIRHAAQLKLPVLLIHGELDALVNVEQSASMAKALQMSGNAARLVRIPNGDADLAAPQARLTLMREVEAFLQKNLSPR